MTVEDRKRLRRMADIAEKRSENTMNRAYARGVADVLRWLDGGDMTPMLKEVTR
jgi:hypothetical protein